MLGVILGLMLGIGLAFMRDTPSIRGALRSRDQRQARHPFSLEFRAAEEASPQEPAGDGREPAQCSGGGVPDAARQPRIREPRPRCALDSGHQRARAGGQVDDGRQPRRGAGARGGTSLRSSTSTSADRRSRSSSGSTALASGRDERRRSGIRPHWSALVEMRLAARRRRGTRRTATVQARLGTGVLNVLASGPGFRETRRVRQHASG